MIPKPLYQVFFDELTHRCKVHFQDSGIIAVSGGADSTVLSIFLLRAAKSLKLELTAVAVDHGLRTAAAAEVDQVGKLCDDLGIPLEIEKVDAAARARSRGCGLEAAAREVRYEALERQRQRCGANWIALGHTRSDLAETVLLRLERGTGLDGLACMWPRRGKLVRPMLTLGRLEIRTYLAELGIHWSDDESNSDLRFERSRIRSELLPLLNESTLAEIATLAAASRKRLARGEAAWATANVIDLPQGGLIVDGPWLDGPPATTRRYLRCGLARLGVGPPSRVETDKLRLLSAGAGGRGMSLKHSEIFRETGAPSGLVLMREAQTSEFNQVNVTKKGSYRLDSMRLTVVVGTSRPRSPLWGIVEGEAPFSVRRRLPGDRLALNGKKLKRRWQRVGLWRKVRDWVPVVLRNEMVQWTAVDPVQVGEGVIVSFLLDDGHPLRAWSRWHR